MIHHHVCCAITLSRIWMPFWRITNPKRRSKKLWHVFVRFCQVRFFFRTSFREEKELFVFRKGSPSMQRIRQILRTRFGRSHFWTSRSEISLPISGYVSGCCTGRDNHQRIKANYLWPSSICSYTGLIENKKENISFVLFLHFLVRKHSAVSFFFFFSFYDLNIQLCLS